ncbi:MAG: hypothetical protein UX38_C0004G0028 [Microgenomates group bacterium GW2011_GWC1_46_16]|nr:MAG: hypothetical protein UX38_C0004G0028 [Microgenomates group bacterium GW2011_GWC1_46_16]
MFEIVVASGTHTKDNNGGNKRDNADKFHEVAGEKRNQRKSGD